MVIHSSKRHKYQIADTMLPPLFRLNQSSGSEWLPKTIYIHQDGISSALDRDHQQKLHYQQAGAGSPVVLVMAYWGIVLLAVQHSRVIWDALSFAG